MKKKVWLSGLIALSLLFSFGLGAIAAPKLSVWFNNKAQKTDIRIINKKPYVPLSDIATLFGGKVTFDKKANAYKVTSKDFNPTPAKSYNVNVTAESTPMKMTISKVTVDPAFKKDKYSDAIKAVILDVKVQNTSTGKVNWHPTQGIYALNNGEQIEDAIIYSDQVDGEFLGNTIKSGRIVLKVNTTKLDEIKSMQISINGAFDDELNRLGEDVLFDLKFR